MAGSDQQNRGVPPEDLNIVNSYFFVMFVMSIRSYIWNVYMIQINFKTLTNGWQPLRKVNEFGQPSGQLRQQQQH